MKHIESIKEFGGFLNRYRHFSDACQCDMTFSVYLPPQAEQQSVPVLYWLSGLTCSDDNARTKAGMQRYAAEQGIAIVFPDTSPRGDDVPDIAERYDLGRGAGFYVNATQQPWAKHFQMYDYVVHELPALVEKNLAVIPGLKSISGHSMGGHGALTCALKNPDNFVSVSAFAPICNPVNGQWGHDIFSAYLGDDKTQWQTYDACCLIESGAKCNELLIDQGLADEFYPQQLLTNNLVRTCEAHGQKINCRMQPGYDHSYHFITSFIGEHIQHHATALRAAN